MGVTECDNMLMLLGVSNKMSEKVRSMSFDAFWQISAKSQMCYCYYFVIINVFIWAFCFCSDIPGSLQERDKVMPLIIQGFKDASEEAGTSVTGGQTVLNPWVVMGGVATTVCQPNEFIM